MELKLGTTLALIALLAVLISTIVTGVYIALQHQQAPQPEVNYESMYKADSQLVAEMENIGEPVNASQLEIKYILNGENYSHSQLPEEMKRNQTCFTSNTTWENGEKITCGTGIKFPAADTELQIVTRYREQKWSETCNPTTSSAVGC
ncbi:hypothetical protein GKQ38_00025 [Candidatus Nanohaloarchaea archaeon]|nr:hypothetical protein GKQ38_00025 [Candidatus Nanohaloarchaea archaeon]